MTRHRTSATSISAARSNLPRPPADPTDWRAWIDYGLAWAPAHALSGHAAAEQRRIASRALGANDTGETTLDRLCLTMRSYREPLPGARWQALFESTWPAYRAWYLHEGVGRRAGLAESRRQLARHMPELVPTWRRLVELADGDETAAALLTMWRLPVFAAGCSQAVLPGPDPVLVRNYDYDPALFEGVVASTNYSGRRRVIGTSDLLWGLVDGMNEDGLAVSLTYGGRPGGGPGFAIPLVLRYVLETCADVTQAVATLRRVPVAQAYNIALVDRSGAHATVFVAPGEEPAVSDLRVSTNHRLDAVEFPEIAGRLGSVERQRLLLERVGEPARSEGARDCGGSDRGSDCGSGGGRGGEADSRSGLIASFTRAPLRSERYSAGFGTLYTAVYHPAAGTATYRWPGTAWTRGFDDDDEVVSVSVTQR